MLGSGFVQVLEAVRAAEAALGPIDLAVANAGVATMGEPHPIAPQRGNVSNAGPSQGCTRALSKVEQAS